MAKISEYERFLVESALQGPPQRLRPGVALVLLDDTDVATHVHQIAIHPALAANELNRIDVVRVFDSESSLSEIAGWIAQAVLIIADVSTLNPHVLYVLGLCHGLGRCPILLVREMRDLPFNLRSFRYVEYAADREGLVRLRHNLDRAVRIFLAAARATGEQGEGKSE